jgi:hypothetical protein
MRVMHAVRRAAVAGGAVLMMASCASKPAADSGSARQVLVTGTILTAPTCPVEHPGRPCPPRAVPGAVITIYLQTKQVFSTTAGRDGNFSLQLGPGSYRVQAALPNGLRSTASTDVMVATTPVHVTLILESGIR